jgi:drug/metabolite transporter (DMT)-like permease
VPSVGVVSVSLAFVALVMAIPALVTWPDGSVPASTWWSILALAVLCTGIAFLVFFALIREIGPSRATLITFVNPAVAIVLGAVFLDEAITAATLAGFVLVMAGCWLATRPAPEPHTEAATADITR